jgi:excisionase family DNA binding protein
VQRDSSLNLQQAAKLLGVSATVVRSLIQRKALPATQIVPGAPWQIDGKDVASPKVIRAATALKNREDRMRQRVRHENTLPLPGLLEQG